MGVRANVSGGAGGERWDRRATVKAMARKVRRSQDREESAVSVFDDDDGCASCEEWE